MQTSYVLGNSVIKISTIFVFVIFILINKDLNQLLCYQNF